MGWCLQCPVIWHPFIFWEKSKSKCFGSLYLWFFLKGLLSAILCTNFKLEQFSIIIHLPGLSVNRVTCCVVFCSVDDVFHSVIRCSLALANCSNSQGTIFSRKAKSWALTQLRRASTPTLKHSNLVEVGEYWGYSAEESTEMMVDKVLRRTKTFAVPLILLQR